jgi:hypothetical protein
MKISYYSIIILTLFLLIGNNVKAQNPLSLYYLENVPQATSINPAMVPRANSFFGIPGVNSIYGGFNTDMLGPDLIQKVDGGYVTLTDENYDYSSLYSRIGKAANFSAYETLAPIVFGFSGKKGYFTFSWTEKLNQSLAIPKDFISIIDQGGLKAGTQLDLSPFAINAQYYREFSFGYSYKVMSNLRVGVHAKLLQGLAAVKTDIETFNLEVNYDDPTAKRHVNVNMDLDGTVYMSAPIEVYSDENGVPDSIVTPETDMSTIIDKGILNFSNPGFAFDVGAVYDYSEAWTFSGSINDLGFIRWRGDLNSFTANGQYSFSGVEANELSSDSLSSGVDDLMDSIKSSVNLTHGNKGFSTGLGPKIYLGAKYNVNHYFSLGALSRTVFAKNDFRQEFNVSANLNLYHVLTTTLNYTVAINGANTIGFGLALRGGPFQFYIAADYLPYAYRTLIIVNTEEDGEPTELPYTPTKVDNFNIMFGFNLIFGANGYRDEPMIDAYSEF